MRIVARIATSVLWAGVAMLAAACTASAGDLAVGADAADGAATRSVAGASEGTSATATSDGDASPSAVTAPSEDGPTATQTVPAPAVAALDFQARRLGGGTMDGPQLAGGDVALWMWAPWCPQCNREAPHVAAALEAYGDEVTFVGMAGHDTDEAHRAFVAEHGLDAMVHLVDDDGSLWAQYGVSYQPAWVFIDEDGTRTVVAGGLYEDLSTRLQALVDG